MSRSISHRNRQRKIFLTLTLSLLLITLIFLGMGRYGWVAMIRLDRQKSRIKYEMLVNLAHNEILCREINRLKNDKLYIEANARENLGMVKPGEVSYRFYPADSIKKRP